MNRFYYLICIILLSNVWTTVRGTSKQEVKLCIDKAYAPFEFSNSHSNCDGFTLDIFDAISKEVGINYSCQFKRTNNPHLQANNNDIFIYIGNDSSVQNQFILSEPFSSIDINLVCRHGSSINIWKQLNDKAIISLREDPSILFLHQKGIKPDITYINNATAGLRLLAAGKHDAMICNKDVAYYYIKQLRLDNLTVSTIPIISTQMQFAMPRNGKNNLLMAKIDNGLRIIRNNGSYNHIYAHWFMPKQGFPISVFIVLAIVAIALISSAFIVYCRILKKNILKSKHDNFTLRQEYKLSISNILDICSSLNTAVAIFKKDGSPIYINNMFIELCKSSNTSFPLKLHNNLFESKLLTDEQKLTLDAGQRIEFIFNSDSTHLALPFETNNKYFSKTCVLSIAIKPITNSKNDIECFMSTFRDINNSNKRELKIEQLSTVLKIATDTAKLFICYYDINENSYYAIDNAKLKKTSRTYETTIHHVHPLYKADYIEFFITAKNGERDKSTLNTCLFDELSKRYEFRTTTLNVIRDEHNDVIGLIQTISDSDFNHKHTCEINNLKLYLKYSMKYENFNIWNYFPHNDRISFPFNNDTEGPLLQHFYDIMNTEDQAKAKDVLNDILSGKTDESYCVIRLKTDIANKYRYIGTHLKAIKNHDATLQRIIGIYSDITQNYIHLRELEEFQTNAQLIRDKGGISQFVYQTTNAKFVLEPLLLSDTYHINLLEAKQCLVPESVNAHKQICDYLKSNSMKELNVQLTLKAPKNQRFNLS